MEGELRERLRAEYDLTLPQFDVLAALARRPGGMTMTEISRYLMVSNGNVTGIVDRLAEEGWAERVAAPGDRRAKVVRLTERGAARFQQMAICHQAWVDALLDVFSRKDVALLIDRLDVLVERLRGSQAGIQPGSRAGSRAPASGGSKGRKLR
jgi:DNA-binding MarR family transcriptional regulator